jgi:hypothetical protein
VDLPANVSCVLCHLLLRIAKDVMSLWTKGIANSVSEVSHLSFLRIFLDYTQSIEHSRLSGACHTPTCAELIQ